MNDPTPSLEVAEDLLKKVLSVGARWDLVRTSLNDTDLARQRAAENELEALLAYLTVLASRCSEVDQEGPMFRQAHKWVTGGKSPRSSHRSSPSNSPRSANLKIGVDKSPSSPRTVVSSTPTEVRKTSSRKKSEEPLFDSITDSDGEEAQTPRKGIRRAQRNTFSLTIDTNFNNSVDDSVSPSFRGFNSPPHSTPSSGLCTPIAPDSPSSSSDIPGTPPFRDNLQIPGSRAFGGYQVRRGSMRMLIDDVENACSAFASEKPKNPTVASMQGRQLIRKRSKSLTLEDARLRDQVTLFAKTDSGKRSHEVSPRVKRKNKAARHSDAFSDLSYRNNDANIQISTEDKEDVVRNSPKTRDSEDTIRVPSRPRSLTPDNKKTPRSLSSGREAAASVNSTQSTPNLAPNSSPPNSPEAQEVKFRSLSTSRPGAPSRPKADVKQKRVVSCAPGSIERKKSEGSQTERGAKVLPSSLFRAITADPRGLADEKKRKEKGRDVLAVSEGGSRPNFHLQKKKENELKNAEENAAQNPNPNSPTRPGAVLPTPPRTNTIRLCDKFGSSKSKVGLIRTLRDGIAPDFYLPSPLVEVPGKEFDVVLSLPGVSLRARETSVRSEVISDSDDAWPIYTVWGILPESPAWNPRSFIFRKTKSIYSEKFLPEVHENWIGGANSKGIFVVSVFCKNGIVYFVENSCMGYIEWERVVSIDKKLSHPFLESDGTLSKKKIERELNSRYETGMVQRLPRECDVYNALSRLDVLREKGLKLEIGVFYRTQGQATREEICANKKTSRAFGMFLRAMGVPYSGGSATTSFQEKPVQWWLCPKLEEEHVRSRVGNCLTAIIFNDSEEPFDPTKLHLGEMTNFVCVVQPLSVAVGKRTKTCYRIGFYFCYTVRSRADFGSTKLQKEQEKTKQSIQNIQIGPVVPENYLFDDFSIREFILCRLHNGMLAGMETHPAVRHVTSTPMACALEELAKLYAPHYYASWQKFKSAMGVK
eukprot:TRINITY_DN3943_c0_g1_i1.p1 TRINITY_DN3943_c0_g1~~TRINITY_DN3943_c0_g1_i1.p1  ORF type:complete len:995 (-),score=192.45 TRINITY_DN3943_c0_g1_i1:126-3083(-)